MVVKLGISRIFEKLENYAYICLIAICIIN